MILKRARFWSLLSVMLIVAAVGCSKGTTATGEGGGPIAPELRFTLKDVNGQDVSLDSALAANKAVLVNFWATWCPPCREEIPDLIKLQEKHGKDGFTVLGVDVGESAAKVSAYGKKAGVNYPLLLDTDQGVAEKYRVVGIPTSLLMDSQGRVIGEYHAVTDALKEAVADAVKGASA